MHKIRTLIVDDEPLALSLLRAKLSKHAEIDLVGECKNGREAISATLDLAPDLIFLDIQMPGLNGFDVIRNLQADVLPLVVFATAFEQYALDAFDVHAVDYILKPIDDERIHRSIMRAVERLDSEQEEQPKSRMISAIDAINKKETNNGHSTPMATDQTNAHSIESKIVVKDRDEITLLKQQCIEWVDAAGDYCCLHAQGQTHIKRTTLKDLLDELDPNIFKRVHRSTIVNLNFISKVIPHTKGEFFLQLNNDERIKVSRNYKDTIKAFIAS